jgi:hypothetical protein
MQPPPVQKQFLSDWHVFGYYHKWMAHLPQSIILHLQELNSWSQVCCESFMALTIRVDKKLSIGVLTNSSEAFDVNMVLSWTWLYIKSFKSSKGSEKLQAPTVAQTVCWGIRRLVGSSYLGSASSPAESGGTHWYIMCVLSDSIVHVAIVCVTIRVDCTNIPGLTNYWGRTWWRTCPDRRFRKIISA